MFLAAYCGNILYYIIYIKLSIKGKVNGSLVIALPATVSHYIIPVTDKQKFTVFAEMQIIDNNLKGTAISIDILNS